MTEYENEPIPGLPGLPPPGEHILWQGSPDPRVLARAAFHTRLVAGYFAVLAVWALASALSGGVRRPSDLIGVAATIAAGVAGVGLLHLLGRATARSTIYTLTNRRLVLRIGVALPKCINLPLGLVGSVDLAPRVGGTGDVALTVIGRQRLGYLALWPHARPWKLGRPQPMLRALPDAESVAALIARTCLAANPDSRIAPTEIRVMANPAFAEAAAA